MISDNGSQWDLAPNAESIQEFKAVTTAYDASYGHEAGGAVNFTIKAGTNNWHGDIFEYLRNSVLDSNFYQSNFAGQAKGRHEVSQFGGILGGPIRKDKDFLFLSFEGWQEAIPFPGAGTTTFRCDLRNGQNFSKYGIAIYDPLTTHLCGSIATEPCSGSNGSTYWRDPFPGNVIPANRISPVATKILSYVPGPNTPGQGAGALANNFFNTNNEGRYWYNQPMARWDHVFGERDKFYALFSEQHGFEYRSTNGFAPPVVGSGNIDNNRTFTGLTLDETHVLTPFHGARCARQLFPLRAVDARLYGAGAIDYARVGRNDGNDSGSDGEPGGDSEHQYRRLRQPVVRVGQLQLVAVQFMAIRAQPDLAEGPPCVALRF